MARKPTPKPDDPEQYKRFLEAAKEAQADKTEAGADRAFKTVAKPIRAPKPAPSNELPKSRKTSGRDQ